MKPGEVRTYTIDLRGEDDVWQWKLYKVGGSFLVDDGDEDSVEAAVDAAKTRMLIEHRSQG